MNRFISRNVDETIKIATRFSKTIKKPCIILLHGDLGAGKTHFVKGFTKGLKSKAQVTSPTFTIMNIYEGGRFPVYHFDMYRLGSEDEAIEAGLEEYFDLGTLKGISIVEWPENVKKLFNGIVLNVTINKLNEEQMREIIISEEKC